MEEAWTLWFTGLHGSGKSTIARGIMSIFEKNNISAALLDGDKLRKTISNNNFRKSLDFDWDNIHKRYMQEYEKLLKNENL